MNSTQIAGLKQSRKSRRTGAVVSIYDGSLAGLDTDGGSWSIVCEEHNECLAVSTLRLAKSLASYSEEWCEGCAS